MGEESDLGDGGEEEGSPADEDGENSDEVARVISFWVHPFESPVDTTEEGEDQRSVTDL